MLINVNPDELCYYLFVVSSDVCSRSLNNFDDPSHRLCLANKPDNLNLKVHQTIKGINESKLLVKHIFVTVDVH